MSFCWSHLGNSPLPGGSNQETLIYSSNLASHHTLPISKQPKYLFNQPRGVLPANPVLPSYG